MRQLTRFCTYFLLGLVFVSVLLRPSPVEAGIYDADAEVTYKEYWVSHSEFTGGCGSHEVLAGGSWYLEPWPCAKTLAFEVADDFSQALKAEIYLDLWRNHDGHSARFSLNGGPAHAPDVGYDWSRTPFIAEIPKSELQQGTNTITLRDAAGGYHVHDIGFRIYHDGGHPLLPGSGSDVTPPDGQLTSIVASNGTFSPASGGTLVVDDDQVTVNATASGGDVKFVEFHAYYYGYDEDNDGQFLDWHNLGRNNFHPGGIYPQPRGGTIDHIGTDAGAPYAATVMLQEVDTCRITSYGVDGALWLARRLGMQAVCGPALEGLSGIARSGAPAQDSDSTIEWIHLSSANGDLPAPSSATQQTASLILDVDQDGKDDFVIGSRQAGPALVWYRRNADGWTKYLIDNSTLGIEAGGTFGDIDRDGDLDVVMGGTTSATGCGGGRTPTRTTTRAPRGRAARSRTPVPISTTTRPSATSTATGRRS